MSIYNEDLKKQCSEESDGVQLVEVFSQPSSSHIDVPYDLEQFGAYTQSYQRISPCDEYDDMPHHTDVYISPIQSWIEEACKRTYQFGKQFNDLLHDYNLSSNPPILKFQACFQFLNNIFFPWLVTKEKEFFFCINKILRWLHWNFDYT